MKFTLKNKIELINLNGYTPELILPTYSGLGYLDIKVNELITLIKNRNFQINGIDIKFDLKGIGANKKITVEEIKGNDFRIILNDTGFHKIIIPKLMLQKVKIANLTTDDLLIILYKYSGNTWSNDKKKFYEDDIKNNSKKNGHEKSYVIYDTLYTGKNDKFIHNNYCNNEFDLDLKYDSVTYKYSDVENEILEFLDFVIEFISYSKETEFNIDIFKQPLKIPLTNKLITKKIYTFIPEEEYRRLHWLNSGIDESISASMNYGLVPTLRLVPLGVKIPNEMNSFVFEGFIWGELFNDDPKEPVNTKDVFKPDYIQVELNLHNFANVFVVDKYIERQKRKEIFGKYKSPILMSKEDEDILEYTLASTLIHINDYQDNYAEPVILIKRELHPDEISI